MTKKHTDPLKAYYHKIPKFYKELGWKACSAYVRQKFYRKGSTAHWVLNIDGMKFVFWTKYWPRDIVIGSLNAYRKRTGNMSLPHGGLFADRPSVDLETASINKPLETKRYPSWPFKVKY